MTLVRGATAALAALMFTACAARTPEVADHQHWTRAVDAVAADALARGEVVGLSVAVLEGDTPVYVRGYGTADLESTAAASAETRYHVGSITKVFTAAAVLHLAERGLLGLDDAVTLHVPELADDGPPVTLRHLLNHTSGLVGPQQVLEKFVERRHLEHPRDQLLGLLVGEARVAQPGERYAYNNLGYVVLGIVIERVSGMSYEDYLQSELAAPVAASSVLLCDARRIIPHRARGYGRLRDGTLINHEPVNASLVFSAGGLCADAEDVARWFRALATGKVITPASFREMSTLGTLTDGTVLPYGYGLFVDEVGGLRRVHHGGDVNGFSGHVAHYPDHDVTVVVLTNTRSTAARTAERRIAGSLLDFPETGEAP